MKLKKSWMRAAVLLSLMASATAAGQKKDGGAEEGAWNVNDAKTNPVAGSPDAKAGGTLVWGQVPFTSGLNYYIVFDVYSRNVMQAVVEVMCDLNPVTAELVPILAEKWRVSPDKKSIKVFLNPKAKYPDGSPVVADDVKTYYDLIMNPKHLTAAVRSNLEAVSGIKVDDERSFTISFNSAHFRNLEVMCSMAGMKKDFWAKGDFNKDFNTKIYGSGPYEVASYKRGEEIVMKRRADYWGWHLPINQGRYNFDKVVFRKVNDDGILFEMFKKGEIDMFQFTKAATWKTETDSEHFKNNWVVARRADVKMPKGFAGTILNMRNPLLKDVKVRKALNLAFDRDRFIKDLFHNNYSKLASYFPNSIFADPKAQPTPFDLKEARKLLAEAGFSKVNDQGILINDAGSPLRLTYLYTSKDTERYLTIYKSDLKKIGVDLNLEMITWATQTKKLDTFSFDMAGIGWSANVNPDPTQLWSSKFADVDSSSNYPGLKDKEVDRLIESAYPVFDRAERAKAFHQLDAKLFENYPYVLGWFLDHYRIGYQNKFGFPESFIPDYMYEYDAWQFAWYDEAKAKALAEARKAKKPLPPVDNYKGPHS